MAGGETRDQPAMASSWHQLFSMLALLAVFGASSWAIPVAEAQQEPGFFFQDQQAQSESRQFRPPALPSALPLQGESEKNNLPDYPPLDSATLEGQQYIDSQSLPAEQPQPSLPPITKDSLFEGVVAVDASVGDSTSESKSQSNLFDLEYDVFDTFDGFGEIDPAPEQNPLPAESSLVDSAAIEGRMIFGKNSLPIIFPSDESSDFASIQAAEQLAQQLMVPPQEPEIPFQIEPLTDNEPFHSESQSEIHITESNPQSHDDRIPELHSQSHDDDRHIPEVHTQSHDDDRSVPEVHSQSHHHHHDDDRRIHESHSQSHDDDRHIPELHSQSHDDDRHIPELHSQSHDDDRHIPELHSQSHDDDRRLPESDPRTHAGVHIAASEPLDAIPKIVNRPGSPNFGYAKPQEAQPGHHSFTHSGSSGHPVASNNGAGAQTHNPSTAAIFFPQDPYLTQSSYSVVPASSYPLGRPSGEIDANEGPGPYRGFLATWWNTGSARQAVDAYANNLWNGFTSTVGSKVGKKFEKFNKIVGSKVQKKSKKILLKAVPFVKKIVGAKVVANLLQGAGFKDSEVGAEASVVPTVIEYKAPAATYGAPVPETRHVEPEAPEPVYGAPPPQIDEPAPGYGAPPSPLPAASYGAPPPQIDEPAPSYGAPPSPFPAASYGAPPPQIDEPAPSYGAPPSLPVQSYSPSAPIPAVFKPEVREPKYHDVLEPTVNQHTYPAVPKPEYDPAVEYRPIPIKQQPIPVPAPLVYQPAPATQQVHHQYYKQRQAPHVDNHGHFQEHSKKHGITKPRKGVFGIVEKVEEGYNNVYQYGQDLTNQATETLTSLWQGNWFRSNGEPIQAGSAPLASQYGPPAANDHYGPPREAQYLAPTAIPYDTPAAPAKHYPAHYLVQKVVPVVAYSQPQVNAEGNHVYHYPVKSDVPSDSGYVAHYEHETAHAPYAPSYVAPLPEAAYKGAEGKEGKSTKGSDNIFDKKISKAVNYFA